MRAECSIFDVQVRPRICNIFDVQVRPRICCIIDVQVRPRICSIIDVQVRPRKGSAFNFVAQSKDVVPLTAQAEQDLMESHAAMQESLRLKQVACDTLEARVRELMEATEQQKLLAGSEGF